MRHPNLVLLATLPFCWARQNSFSIHDDVLAHPQFEVIFSDAPILETEAQILLDRKQQPSQEPQKTADATSSQTDLTSQTRESATADSTKSDTSDIDDGSPQVSESFELVVAPPQRYLCSIPVLAPPPAPNQTATDLAKAAEARELQRASTRGWEIMSALDGQCMYFVSGWWSYSFCYGKEVVQFHALAQPGANGAPQRDPMSQEYVLGRAPPKSAAGQPVADTSEVAKPAAPGTNGIETELVVRGDQRYLVQRLGLGTVCDLTGRDRTVEIQYHCNPGATGDRINWIKEITTCTYLMEIKTPRLCEDVAFLPPKPTRAHAISCRPIVQSNEEGQWYSQKRLEGHNIEDKVGTAARAKAKGPVNIGGVVVGAQMASKKATEDGHAAPQLKPPKSYVSGKLPSGGQQIDILAFGQSKQQGGEVRALDAADVQKLDLDPDQIQALAEELQKLAADEGWRLELVEGRDVRGLVGDDPENGQYYQAYPSEEQGDAAAARAGDAEQPQQGETMPKKVKPGDENPRKQPKKHVPVPKQEQQEQPEQPPQRKQPAQAQAKGKGANARAGGDDGDDEGSEETYWKDEL